MSILPVIVLISNVALLGSLFIADLRPPLYYEGRKERWTFGEIVFAASGITSFVLSSGLAVTAAIQ